MIAQGLASDADTARHRGRLVWRAGAAICPIEELGVRPHTRRILFQPAPEEKTIKNRMHWDVSTGGRDKDEIRRELQSRGATFLWTARQGTHSWHTMADPEGNEFCVF